MHGYEAVIGLEVHAQLATATKIFCSCATEFGAEPNDQTCPVCLGLPGSLPVLNREVITFAAKFGHAVGAQINDHSVFARKNYFYPDLPKGYQISQYDQPIVSNGHLEISLQNGGKKNVRIARAHLEEDAGQSVHDGMPQSQNKTYINLNRAGIPLLEIVTEPDLSSPDEVYEYLTELKSILQYLEICDGNMEEGSLRCDANVSIRPIGQKKLGTRTEMKNLNSFNHVRRAVQHEIDRQIAVVLQGGVVDQVTLLWDAESQRSRVMRGKEESHDYRYFPDPDLLPIVLDQAANSELANRLPELPQVKRKRFIEDFELPQIDAHILTNDKHLAAYFEAALRHNCSPKLVANWMLTELLRELKGLDHGIDRCPIAATDLGRMVALIEGGEISGKMGKQLFRLMFDTGKAPDKLLVEHGMVQIKDETILIGIVEKTLGQYEDQVEQYRSGKTKVLGFLVGQIMRETKGKANPNLVNQLLIERLNAEMSSHA